MGKHFKELILLLLLIVGTVNISTTYADCGGMNFNSFKIRRTTLGQADNNQDGLPDANGVLNERRIRYNNAMFGDKFTTSFKGEVGKKGNINTWEYAYASTTFLRIGNSLDIQSAVIKIKDASSGRTYTCDRVKVSSAVVANNFEVNFDFSMTALAANGCKDFEGFKLEKGDELDLIATYKVVKNIGARYINVFTRNEFFLSTVANPTRPNQIFSCGAARDYVRVLGYEFISTLKRRYDFNTCQIILEQDFGFYVGPGILGSAFFPFEYRNWSHIKDLVLELPKGYVINNALIRQFRSVRRRRFIAEEKFGIQPDAQNGNRITYNLAQYYKANGGNIHFSNNTFVGQILVRVSTDRTAANNVFEKINWTFDFNQSDLLTGGSIPKINAESIIRNSYNQFDLHVQEEPSSSQDGEISWEMEIEKVNAGDRILNPWIYFESPSADIEVIEIIDLRTDKVIKPKNGIFWLPRVRRRSENYRIIAKNSSCEKVELTIFAGNEDRFFLGEKEHLECLHDNDILVALPEESSFDAKLLPPDQSLGYPLTTELQLFTTGSGSISDVMAEVKIPTSESILISPESVEIEYPVGTGFRKIENPILNNGTYQIKLADALLGNNDLDRNTINLRFGIELQANFKSGDIVKVASKASQLCGDPIKAISDEFSLFQTLDLSQKDGLEEAYNSWGFSWGDYDNDGYPDLFVTNYEVDQPNRLYHNNANGTFTKVTEGAIANELASSIGSSWGDYDNDGFLDLYVTNNIGSTNFLYRNNGDGTFTSIKEDPSVAYTGYSHGVSWVDYDNDGFLDLFITDFFTTKFNLLYHNNGDGTFSKNSTSILSLEANSSIGGAWADYDNDGDQDLFVANTNDENNSLYRNDGSGDFTKISVGAIVNDGGKSIGGSWGDIDNDGDLDLFVTNAGNQNNFFYINNGDGSFTARAEGEAVSDGGHSHGSAFGDYDNDGFLDLVVTNDQDQDNFFYLNDGTGHFKKTDLGIGFTGGTRKGSEVRSPESASSFAAGWADYDLDGDLDLYVVNYGNNENFLFVNKGGNLKNSACLNFTGKQSNVSAIGTKIYIKANIYGNDVWQYREIAAQTGGGVSAQNNLVQHVGLGDANVIDSLIIVWPSGLIQTETNVAVDNCLSLVEKGGTTITGVAFNDLDGDCEVDDGEALLSNMEITIQPGGQTVYSDANGEYQITLPPGDYSLLQNNSTNWESNCGNASQTYDVSINPFSRNEVLGGFNFANTSTGACTSVDLKVTGVATALRVGFASLYAIKVENNGTMDATSVEMEVDFGSDILPTSSSIPWTSNTGTVYSWSLTDVAIGEVFTIYVSTMIDANAIIGDVTRVGLAISSTEIDCNDLDNEFKDQGILVGAIDPNDILVSPEGAITSDEVLQYKIRFQNVGNAAVKRVVIEDQIPEALDLSTLELGSASHSFRFHVEEDRTLVWEFENINLIDSTTNEVESNGFVSFRIKPASNLANGTKINNQGAIYFDFSEVVNTNIVHNIIEDELPGKGGTLTIFPNPVSSFANFRINPRDLSLKQVDIRSVTIFNSFGQLVHEARGLEQFQYRMDDLQLTSGYYVVKILGADNNEYTGRMIVQ